MVFMKHKQIVLDLFSSGLISCNKDGDIFRGNRKIKPLANVRHKYLSVNLCFKGTCKIFVYVHQLTYLYFNRDNNFDGKQINHIDGNKQNNSLSNLELVSRKENMQHAKRLGLLWKRPDDFLTGENGSASKLNWDKVSYIRKSYPEKTQLELAKELSVTQSAIYYVVNNKTWRERHRPKSH